MTKASAQFAFAAQNRDLDALAQRSAALWAGLAFDQEALAALRRDGLDPGGLRLTRPHPYSYDLALDWAVAVTARGGSKAEAEALLDLFRVYFLRRLGA